MIESFRPRESLSITKRKHLYDVRGYITIQKQLGDGRVETTQPRPNELTNDGKMSLVVALTGEADWAPYPYYLDSDAEIHVLSKTSTERVAWRAVDAAYPAYEEDYRARLQWIIPDGIGTGDWDQIFLRDGNALVVLTQFLDGYLDWGDKGPDDTWTVKYDFIAR